MVILGAGIFITLAGWFAERKRKEEARGEAMFQEMNKHDDDDDPPLGV